MEEEVSANTPEPKPQRNTNTPVWDLVIQDAPDIFTTSEKIRSAIVADMRERDDMGREKYGVPLQAGNGRNPATDAYQEALDLCAYLKQATEEGSALHDT